MRQWIKKIFNPKPIVKSDFELAFLKLKRLGDHYGNEAVRTYKMLGALDHQSDKQTTEELINALKDIRFASNTNAVFYFYLPIVSYILYYKPAYENEILGYIIGPLFANGEFSVEGMIKTIQGSMNFKLKEDRKYLTRESQIWIMQELPKMKLAVKREIDRCQDDLNE